MTRRIIIGTRGSDLALWQANYVRSGLARYFPETEFEIKIIRTTGDQLQEIALSKIGDKGLFTRQIEAELLGGQIDIAVHSLKDLQTVQPEGLMIGAVCERELPNDVLVSKEYSSIAELPHGASLATGSLRRRSQLLNLRPDLRISEIRGNVPTRMKKYIEGTLDGMILAYAGLRRLELDGGLCHLISTKLMLPAVGQGAVAVELRTDDKDAIAMTSRINHMSTLACVIAERSFLRHLEGGCQVPIGALATTDGDSITLDGLVGSLDGSRSYRETSRGRISVPDEIGTHLAKTLIERGAGELLEEARHHAAYKTEAVL